MNRKHAVMRDSLKRTVLFITVMSSFLAPFMASGVNISLPALGREFGLDAVSLGWIATSYLLASALFLLPFGRLADIHGRRRIFTIGMAIFSVATLMAVVTPTFPLLLTARILQGIGSSMLFGTGAAIITSVFPDGERGSALGLGVSAVYVGLSAGPLIGGLLVQHLGWRSIFLVSGIMGLVVLSMIIFAIEGEWAEARGESFDWKGSAVYAASFTLLMYGLSLIPSARGAMLAGAGIAGMFAFIIMELREQSPILDLGLFRGNAVFTFSNLAALINYSATFAVTFLMSLFLQYVKGFSPSRAGMILMAQPLVMAAVSPVAGRLSDRFEPRIIASSGMACTTLSLVTLAFLGQGTPVPFIVASLMLLGSGIALFSSPNTNAVMGSVERKSYGVASSVLGTMRISGQMISMGVVMLAFAVSIGPAVITRENHHLFLWSVRGVFAVFSILCAAGIFASYARGRVR
ncbi:MAG: MFS transporter [Spirochaetes bacterium]|nr:MFS transporter [Spirochaetota bacterium]